jgi:DNA modification methylase
MTHRLVRLVSGRTQAALYSELDLELSWSEDQLPQVERTKHVHGLHPYLGKFIPQLVDVFLRRYFKAGDCVHDPFVGSGTTVVEANAYGAHAIGCDISAFNCLLARVKASSYALGSLEMSLRVTYEVARQEAAAVDIDAASDWLRAWYSPNALRELLAYRAAASRLDAATRDVANIILSRSARSARLTTHFDLDFPRRPVREAYYCHKHRRTCAPVEEADKFLRRYTADTVKRIRGFAAVRTSAETHVLHGDSRVVSLPVRPTGLVTSPPYPGLIDYHEQHRYSYELLRLEDRSTEEIGPAAGGTGRSALGGYRHAMTEVFRNAREQMEPGSVFVIVVNDSRDLYPEILRRSGLVIEDVLTRHVNRRTGRRSGEFFESVIVARTK